MTNMSTVGCVYLLGLGLSLVSGQGNDNNGSLSLPNARDCANR